jgi:TolB-like protein/DNA-binding winged helix-turn-helix (wHTH) protein/Flp pilus assembly protein TadD
MMLAPNSVRGVESTPLNVEPALASQSTRLQETIRFGDDFQLDLRSFELRRAGRALKLEPIPMEVLLLLIERRDELVTREQIVDKVWGKDLFLDTDNSINSAIRKIRQVLKDDPERPHFVQTVTGRGYRFIAPVVENRQSKGPNDFQIQEAQDISVESLPVAAQTYSPGQAPASTVATAIRTKTLAVLALSLVIVTVLGSAVWLLQMVSHRTNAALPMHSIAVLPLDNFSGDPTQEYFVDGMTDELITDLAKLKSLRVISRASVMRYKGTKKTLPQIARELNVDGIVEGSVSRSGQRLRITAQLINASTDQHLWAEAYDRDLGDALKLQSEVAQVIAQQVRAQLTPQEQARLGSARAVNPEAYEAYLKGRYYFLNEFTKVESLQLSKTYFEEAIRKDPGFALGYAGLADSYVWLGLFNALPPDSAYRQANEALQKAKQLDDTVGEAHDTLAVLNWRFDWNWDAAEREFEKSLALAPSYSCAHEDRSNYLAFMGRRDEAMSELAKSKEIDPGPSSTMTEIATYYQLRDYKGLVESSEREVISNPNEWTGYQNLGTGYEAMGKLPQAIAAYQRAVEISNGSQDAVAALAHAYAAIGRRAETKKLLNNLQRQSAKIYMSPYILATIYAGLGDKDKAFKFLDKAYRERSLNLSWHIRADIRIDNLRSDPRFEDLLRRMGLS